MLALPKRRDGIGFTLVELLIVMAIIAILAGLLLAGVTAARRRAKRSAATIELKNIETALNAYRFDFNRFPPDWNMAEGWDSGQCLVFYLGTAFRAGVRPTPPWGGGPLAWRADRTAPAYFEFPATRIDTTGHFVDPWGTDGRDETGQVYYYQFDNNDDDLQKNTQYYAGAADLVTGRSPYNWNMTNVHPQTVDIWSAGPNGRDLITGGDPGDPSRSPPIPAIPAPFFVSMDSPVSMQIYTIRDGDGKQPSDDVGNW